ncbi:uncharacterized protein LOC113332842 [Papaver somniferum]|uniref:uncharacterized protein LOC113332842 n=1 Tax=Papaver somniferum TaxID=3469 RepID=UPI000E6F84B5|nr:uncharacterized protein LOC113332842 [Papaver somniferum]
MESHKLHLQKVLSVLRQHQLHAKLSKCYFAQTELEYLDHIITAQGVVADPAKISCMTSWPTPNTIKALRGFLGLTGYYRKFVRAAEEAFNKLKMAMTTTPVLTLPDFSKKFILETDASDSVIGAVLMQDGRPIDFHSKPLGLKAMGLSNI